MLATLVQQQHRAHRVGQQGFEGSQQCGQQLLQVLPPRHAFEERTFQLLGALLDVAFGHIGQHAVRTDHLPLCITLNAGVVLQPHPTAVGRTQAVALVVTVAPFGQVGSDLAVDAGQVVRVYQRFVLQAARHQLCTVVSPLAHVLCHELDGPALCQRPDDGHHRRAVDRVGQQLQHGLLAVNFLRCCGQRRFGGLVLAHVHGHAHHVQRLAIGLPTCHLAPSVHPAPCAVEASYLVAHIQRGLGRVVQQPGHAVLNMRVVVGVDAFQHRGQAQRGGVHPVAHAHHVFELLAVNDAVVRDVVLPETELCCLSGHAVTLLGQDDLVALGRIQFVQVPVLQQQPQAQHQAVLVHHAGQVAVLVHHGQVMRVQRLHGLYRIHDGGVRGHRGHRVSHHVGHALWALTGFGAVRQQGGDVALGQQPGGLAVHGCNHIRAALHDHLAQGVGHWCLWQHVRQGVFDHIGQFHQCGRQPDVDVPPKIPFACQTNGPAGCVNHHQVAQFAGIHLAPGFSKRGFRWSRDHRGAHGLLDQQAIGWGGSQVPEHVALGQDADRQTVRCHDQAGNAVLRHLACRVGQGERGGDGVQRPAHDVPQRPLGKIRLHGQVGRHGRRTGHGGFRWGSLGTRHYSGPQRLWRNICR